MADVSAENGNDDNGAVASASASASARSRSLRKFLEARNFGLVIGLAVFLAMIGLTYGTILIGDILEVKWLDFNFRWKTRVETETVQEGVTVTQKNPNISPDILLVGIDERALNRFGRWPFPRFRHADLVENLASIRDQNQRERALFIDVFFIEPDPAAEDDARFVDVIEANGRVFLETSLSRFQSPPEVESEFFERHEELYAAYGTLENIAGDWTEVNLFLGMEPPLKPYARATGGYGHANFIEDQDEIFRRQPLIVRLGEQIDEIRLDELTVDTPVDYANFERFGWQDKEGISHDVAFPLTAAKLRDLELEMRREAPPRILDSDGDGQPDAEFFVVKKYQDSFIPSITLSLAAQYFDKQLDDLEIVLGSHILIPEISQLNPETGAEEPYVIEERAPELNEAGEVVTEGVYRQLDELRIPIDASGQMLVNYMGLRSSASPQEHQTFPVRSYSGYAGATTNPDPARWPRTRGLANKVVMVGAFAKGIADDEKPTPFGLMFGVEIHANALNTIIMDKFLTRAPVWLDVAILFGMILTTAFLASRLSTIWALAFAVGASIGYAVLTLVLFDLNSYILLFSPVVIGTLLTLVGVITYRVVTEERDKRHIREMFGKYVSPSVVDEIMADPPELGGVDKELTVFFSDIRGFSTLSETMSPQELVNHLNVYLGSMTDLILEYQGTLDKYVGDEIMCFWGAPLPQEDHAFLACKCAIEQMHKLRELNAIWPEERQIDIGIGVNTGIMTVGNMGSSGRMNYTLMGDDVNLGARLEGTNKQYLTNVIISESTYEQVKDRVIARELDNIRVKGKNNAVLIYELIAIIDDAATTGANTGNGHGTSGVLEAASAT